MEIYVNLLLVALVTVYVVDISGFTESWRSLVASWLHIPSLRPLPPFDCSTCMTWWMCIIYSILTGEFSLFTIAFAALLSFLSIPFGQVMIFIREWIVWVINRYMP